ncbi:MAG: cytochrome P450 family protein [Candidatus Acidiferrales bacterium]
MLALLKDERFAKNRRNAMTPEQLGKQPWVPPFFRPLERNMLDLDPPDHERLRTLVHKAFTPRLIEQMRAHIESVAAELLAGAAARGRMDLVRDFALPLPVAVITEILGVPAADRGKFHKWSNAIVAVNSLKPPLSVIPNVWLFVRFLRRFFRLRRAEPRDDLTSALIQAEEAGDRMSEDELLAMAFLLLVAGHETTVSLIAGGTLELLRHPDQLEKLRCEPALIPSAVEELLRFVAPVFLSTERFARSDVTLQGVTIPRGGLVFGVIGSANRDPSAFENPDALDITRQNNRHLGFGHGIHFCLGAALARMEAQIAIHALVQRFPKLRLAVPVESLRWQPSLVLRGLKALPVAYA